MIPRLAVRAIVCRADFSSTPGAPSAATSVPVRADPSRVWTNSPRIVKSMERALAALERSPSTGALTSSTLVLTSVVSSSGCRAQSDTRAAP
uniref:Uncharacterized protein n=1 Tax=Janibacter limosus TaxID=53458 RepID=A0AC61U6R3_9MICO|nr:hypothetical protein [Janibacter limosus]